MKFKVQCCIIVIVLNVALFFGVAWLIKIYMDQTHSAIDSSSALFKSNYSENAAELSEYATIVSVSENIQKEKEFPKNCFEIKQKGDSESGIRTVYPYLISPTWGVDVFCDQEIDGGGWTVIQKRDDLPVRVSFKRSWLEYSLGFGNLSGEFWLGLDNIHALTKNVIMELRVNMENVLGPTRYANYDVFYVNSSQEDYMLVLGIYIGTAGDSLKVHNHCKFTTFDRDNDRDFNRNCAITYYGGWWHNGCHNVNLNGRPVVGKYNETDADGIIWKTFGGYQNSLKKVTMMIRPKFVNIVNKNNQ